MPAAATPSLPHCRAPPSRLRCVTITVRSKSSSTLQRAKLCAMIACRSSSSTARIACSLATTAKALCNVSSCCWTTPPICPASTSRRRKSMVSPGAQPSRKSSTLSLSLLTRASLAKRVSQRLRTLSCSSIRSSRKTRWMHQRSTLRARQTFSA